MKSRVSTAAFFAIPPLVTEESHTEFWNRLINGGVEKGKFHRVAKDGHEVCLQATYNPILDWTGRPTKIGKYAQDVTATSNTQALLSATQELAAQLQDASEEQVAIFEAATIGIAFVRDEVILHTNRKLDELMAYQCGMRLKRSDGQLFWSRLSAKYLDPNDTLY